MTHEKIIERALRDCQDILWSNLPATDPHSDADTVRDLREIVSLPAVKAALERGPDTALAFELRAVHRVAMNAVQSNRAIIDHLWSILDHPALNGILGAPHSASIKTGPKKPPTG